MLDWVFFVASKLFWTVARPESLIILCILLAMFYRRVFGYVALGVMVSIGALPVADWMLHPLENRHPANPDISDAVGIVILGGGSRSDLHAHWGTVSTNEHGERFYAALALAHLYPDLPIVFTGGSGSLNRSLPGEASSARSILLATGMENRRLTIEGESRNTAENAAFTKAMLGDSADGTWVLVTSAWHMPRSVDTFCAAGWRSIIPYPVDHLSLPNRPLLNWAFAERLYYVNIAAKEWIGLLAYRWTNRATDASCVAKNSENTLAQD